jgi:hypothetical protein
MQPSVEASAPLPASGMGSFSVKAALRQRQAVLAKLHRQAPVQPVLHSHPTPAESDKELRMLLRQSPRHQETDPCQATYSPVQLCGEDDSKLRGDAQDSEGTSSVGKGRRPNAEPIHRTGVRPHRLTSQLCHPFRVSLCPLLIFATHPARMMPYVPNAENNGRNFIHKSVWTCQAEKRSFDWSYN